MHKTPILIRRASILSDADAGKTHLLNRDIYIQGSRIAKIEERISPDEIDMATLILDAENCLAIPGFVNAHTHNSMTLFRGFSDDLPLMDWLNEIWPAEARMDDEMVYQGMRMACLEMIKSGTTCFYDMYERMPACAKAVDEMGLRCVLAESIFAPEDESGTEQFETFWMDHQALVSDLKGVQEGRIKFALGPHAIYTVREEVLRWIGEKARKEHIPVHVHLSETQGEVEACQKAHGCSPVAYLEKCGLLDNEVIAAHCVHLSDEDIRIMAKYKRLTVVHNPNSNLKLASGYCFRYKELKEAGINVALGTDGCCSSNNLDMTEAMKQASLLQKAWRFDPAIVPAQEALDWATLNGARGTALDAGVLEVGKLADIALVDLKHYTMVPLHNAVSNLVYSAHGGAVKHLICNGKLLMRDRVVEGEEEILQQASEAAMRLYPKK